MLEIINGRIFIDGKETVNPELIGYALLDFAESNQGESLNIRFQDNDEFAHECSKCFRFQN